MRTDRLHKKPLKYSGESAYDSWFLRTVFSLNSDSVASYKFWIPDERKVRGSDIRYITDIRFCFEA